MSLVEGVYFCRFSISGNLDTDGDAEHFSATCEGREGGYKLLANEVAEQWTGRGKIVVREDEFSGVIDVEVEASPTAEWVLTCEKQ